MVTLTFSLNSLAVSDLVAHRCGSLQYEVRAKLGHLSPLGTPRCSWVKLKKKKEIRKIPWIFPVNLVHHHPRAPGYFKTSHYSECVFFLQPCGGFTLSVFRETCKWSKQTCRLQKSYSLLCKHRDLHKAVKHLCMFPCFRQFITQESSEESRPSASVYNFSFRNTMLVYISFSFSLVSLLPLFSHLKSRHLFISATLCFSQAVREP